MSTMMVVGAVQAVVVVTAVLQSTHPPWQAPGRDMNFKVSVSIVTAAGNCGDTWHSWGFGSGSGWDPASLGVGNTGNLLGTCSEGYR